MALYKQKLIDPYYWQKYALRHSASFNLRNKSGVYMIYKNSNLAYVGYSATDLYKTLYRHFQSWADRTQIRVTYNPSKCKVRVIYTSTPKQAEILEKALILKYKPTDNPNQYERYTMDSSEQKILREYINESAQPPVVYAKELPF